MKNLTLILFALLACKGLAQQALTEDAFIAIVKQNHPMVKISNLQPNFGEAYLMKAKGGFDPKLTGSLNQKYFDGKQYYSVGDYGIKYPTWYGITAKAGVENNRGTY